MSENEKNYDYKEVTYKELAPVPALELPENINNRPYRSDQGGLVFLFGCRLSIGGGGLLISREVISNQQFKFGIIANKTRCSKAL